VRLGQVIRKLKQLWPAGCVTAALLHGNPRLGQGLEGEAAPLSPSDAAAAAAAEEPLDGEPDVVATQLRLAFCEALLDAATSYGVADCWQWKPLLDGKQASGGRPLSRAASCPL
jgi:hypothetical protein